MAKRKTICLILEGTYPYVSGGVSSWVHELIKEQSHLDFILISILPPNAQTSRKYDIPKNVKKIHNLKLQSFPYSRIKAKKKIREDFFKRVELPLLNLQSKASLKDVDQILKDIEDYKQYVNKDFLFNSKESWNMILRMYNSSLGNSCFLDYFWSSRSLLTNFFSIMLYEIPDADLYHSLCTGYSGMLLTKAKLTKNKPCFITEHGIYTNERRIEIASADWLEDQKSLNLSINKTSEDRNLQDYWIDTFSCYSSLCYEVCDKIITLYRENSILQISDGADPNKIEIIPNGIDYERFDKIERNKSKNPTIALIGRVVPIKDIKTYIQSCYKLKNLIPNLKAYIMGPLDEDKEYYHECLELVKYYGVDDIIEFTGKVNIDKYLKSIDLIVLTSISEAQPLVLLEAGACGIPFVTTNVGSCSEIANGIETELPNLGQAGLVAELANPESISNAIYQLLNDKEFYKSCSKTVKNRVKTYYNKKLQHSSYKKLYDNLLETNKKVVKSSGRNRICSPKISVAR